MFSILFKRLANKISYFYHEDNLSGMANMKQFSEYVAYHQPNSFLTYQRMSDKKKMEIYTVMSELNLNLQGINFLDLGSGYGDFLDICHSNGAESIEFTELDPFFFTYNRLKEIGRGYKIDHLKDLGKLKAGNYDLIWVKGSITADHFISRFFISRFKGNKRRSLSSWLIQLEALSSSRCSIVICPHWLNDGNERRIEDVYDNLFTSTMVDRGYKILPEIEHHNCNPEYPITFRKDICWS